MFVFPMVLFLDLAFCSFFPNLSKPGCQMSEEEVRSAHTNFCGENITDGSKWVDLFVHEMMRAADLDDARGRAARILEVFERSIITNSKASKEVIESLKYSQ